MAAERTLRARIFEAIEPDEGRTRLTWVSGVLVTMVLVSFITLALETETSRADSGLPAWVGVLVGQINNVIVVAFAGEYLVRLWAVGENPKYRGVGGRLKYMVTPLALADLAAFLPELILSVYFPNASGGIVAALRALRLFRLLKLARYVPAFGIVGAALQRAGPPLLAALAVAAAQVYVAALLLYFVEGVEPIPGHPEQQERFGSVIRAMWWAVVTLTTVGYGDVYPVTPLGRFAAALVALAGIGIVAMPTGILASAFAEEFRERHEKKAREAAGARDADPGGDDQPKGG
ncbi:MAG: ion transporter [Hyphomonadaceae bacterium]|nr:ion transporter [Hyphomonadaceae bacterium]